MQARHVLLISPIGFAANPETAGSNVFQGTDLPGEIREHALPEHQSLVDALEAHGIGVTLLSPHRHDIPDAVFPNNWFSTDTEGNLVLYPMESRSRRKEIRPDFPQELINAGFSVRNVVDIASEADAEVWLEGTGSLVLDHSHQVAFLAESSRSHPDLARKWCALFDFAPSIFTAVDPDGKPIYHTNVLMAVGKNAAVVCPEVIPDTGERDRVLHQLRRNDRVVVEIRWDQLCAFAANALFLAGNDSEIMMMSQRGWQSLDQRQQGRLKEVVKPVPVAVDTLESTGGGSVRCMIAEIFLPPLTS